MELKNRAAKWPASRRETAKSAARFFVHVSSIDCKEQKKTAHSLIRIG